MRRLSLAVLVPLVLLGACGSRAADRSPTTTAAVSATSSTTPAASTTTILPVVASGTEAPASAIPWPAVGNGWYVALWTNPAPPSQIPPPAGAEAQFQTQSVSLYLVDPQGGRYLVKTLPAPPQYSLADWSGDGRRVLVASQSGTQEIDLATGRVLNTLPYAEGQATVLYTRPGGMAALVWTPSLGTGAPSLTRVSLSGSTQLSYSTAVPGLGTMNGPPLPSLDGLTMVVSTNAGLALLANDGTFLRDLRPAGQNCNPLRWWDATDLVAWCGGAGLPAVWIVPVSGAAATQLTHPVGPVDNGDVGAWQLASGIYLQSLGGCGSEYLSVRNPDGTSTKINVPNADQTVRVIGAADAGLGLQSAISCGPGQSLFTFDPATNAVTDLLGPPLNGGSVLQALPYPGLQP